MLWFASSVVFYDGVQLSQAFGYGGSLVRSKEIDGGKVVQVLMSLIMASSGFGQAIPAYNDIFTSRASAADVFDVIDRKSELDPFADTGERNQQFC